MVMPDRIVEFIRRADFVVEAVPLDGRSARLHDQIDELGAGQHLLLVALLAVFIGDLVLVDGAVQIIRAVPLGKLRDLGRVHDPERLDMLEVVQHQAGDGNGAQVAVAGRVRQIGELRAFRVERQRA